MSLDIALVDVTDPAWSEPPESFKPNSDPFACTGTGYTGHGDQYIVETDYAAETVTVYGTADANSPGTHPTEADELVLQYAAETLGGEYQYSSIPKNHKELRGSGSVAAAMKRHTDGLTLSGPLAEDAPLLPETAAGAGPQFSENPAYLEPVAWNPHGDAGRSFAYNGEAITASFTGMKSLHAHARRNFTPANPSVHLALKEDASLAEGLGEYDTLLLDWVSGNADEQVDAAWLADALHIEAPLGEE